jgi:GntR family transcriptional regulator
MHTRKQDVLRSLHLHDAGVPIYVQLREQLARAIGAGRLAPGDQLPTMREVAVALRVDLNTVRRAYDELERLGVLTLERGRGSFVAPDARGDAPTEDDAAHDLANDVLAQARAQGVEPARLVAVLTSLIELQGGLP